ncbi:RNase adapter RapZ [Butyrivibrio sp. CB08]|uniref:RNase adapter RapZ n=1 Tax=Butyrivibrio sp. CB08 TaxID=2364879 RepID=UPI000EA9C452|nr:RNase adapter RapZ [Butyrivibrio sp. CB08]RKM59969.1 RNase adapter RapZ [Butyrivibrio sp. CB08]
MRFVIVTGMSGGGKATAIHMLEDAGFYCVDNLPVSLIEKFTELITMPDSGITKVVLGIDARAGQSFEGVSGIIESLKDKGIPVEILFMDASDQVLIKRYKETRRIHPMNAVGDRLEDGIAKERQVLAEIKSKADYIFDTSSLLTRELKEELDKIFVQNESYNSLMINVLSFGFKYGIPSDADLVFDVRFLPNPYYVDELKHQTGNDKPVQDYVKSFPACGEFVDKLTDMLAFLIPGYVEEGKYQLVIAIGCTGGQHRSVTIANELYDRLKELGGNFGLKLTHRDVKEAK